jgi:membrane-bound lytic murein transglycosylase B
MVSALLFGTPSPAAADWGPLVERLASDGFDRSSVEALFSRPEVRFEPYAMADKVTALVRNRFADRDSAAIRMKNVVRRGYLTQRVINQTYSYVTENLDVLNEINAAYGVPKEIVVSIFLIETNLGRNTGNRCVLNRLASMAASDDLEIVRPYLRRGLLNPDNEEYARRRCHEKGDWAYDEVKALLRLAERDGVDPLGIRGSIYGAIGLCQFMPTNVFTYGVDADRDGRIDPFAKADALCSIANYLRNHGWRPGMDRDEQRNVIFDYNHSTVYANTVLAIADKLKGKSRTRP